MESGDRKENKFGFGGALFLNKIPTPMDMECNRIQLEIFMITHVDSYFCM